MVATRQDLITTVLENLGVLAAGQSASIEDRAVVDRRIDPKLAELGRREVFVGLSADALDPALFLYVADIVAAACLTPFGITGTKAESLVTAAATAEATLKVLSRQFDADVGTSSFYDVVQAAIEMLGVVTAGQSASAKDRAVVTARVRPLLQDLRGRDICGVADVSELSVGLQETFAKLLAASCALSFSEIPLARVALLKGEVPAAESALRYQSFVYDALPPMRVDAGAMQGRRWPAGLLADEFFGAPVPPAEPPAPPASNLPLFIRVDGGREG